MAANVKKETSSLAASAEARLAELEAVIGRGLETFIEVGEALWTIREEKLFAVGHPGRTFEAYCRERWNLTGGGVSQQIRYSIAAKAVEERTGIRLNECGQARAIDKIRGAGATKGRKTITPADPGFDVAARVLTETAKRGKVTASALLDTAEDLGVPVASSAGSPERRRRKASEREIAEAAANPVILTRKYAVERAAVGKPITEDEAIFLLSSLNPLLESGYSLELVID